MNKIKIMLETIKKSKSTGYNAYYLNNLKEILSKSIDMATHAYKSNSTLIINWLKNLFIITKFSLLEDKINKFLLFIRNPKYYKYIFFGLILLLITQITYDHEKWHLILVKGMLISYYKLLLIPTIYCIWVGKIDFDSTEICWLWWIFVFYIINLCCIENMIYSRIYMIIIFILVKDKVDASNFGIFMKKYNKYFTFFLVLCVVGFEFYLVKTGFEFILVLPPTGLSVKINSTKYGAVLAVVVVGGSIINTYIYQKEQTARLAMQLAHTSNTAHATGATAAKVISILPLTPF